MFLNTYVPEVDNIFQQKSLSVLKTELVFALQKVSSDTKSKTLHYRSTIIHKI